MLEKSFKYEYRIIEGNKSYVQKVLNQWKTTYFYVEVVGMEYDTKYRVLVKRVEKLNE